MEPELGQPRYPTLDVSDVYKRQVQQDAPLPFYVGYMEVSYELGFARFSGIEGTTEYTEALSLIHI